MADNMHRYQSPPLWRLFMGQTGCLQCSLARGDEIHAATLMPLLQTVRNTARGIDFGNRRTLTRAQVHTAIQNLVNEHGANAEWLHDRDHQYLAPSYDQLIAIHRDHWRMILPVEVDFSDCDDRMDWYHVWCTLMRITSVANVYDYSNLAHAYCLIVLDDLSVRAYDPGSGMFVNLGRQGPKFEFRDVVLHV